MKMFKWQQTNKHVLSIHLKQNDSREQATFLNFGGNFLIFEQLLSNFWVYCEATFPEFTNTIYSCLTAKVNFVRTQYRESDPGKVGYPTLKRLYGKIWPRLRGLSGLADRAIRFGWSPHLSCKRDQIKMSDYMDRRVTSPTWGLPPPCKQALSHNTRSNTNMTNGKHKL